MWVCVVCSVRIWLKWRIHVSCLTLSTWLFYPVQWKYAKTREANTLFEYLIKDQSPIEKFYKIVKQGTGMAAGFWSLLSMSSMSQKSWSLFLLLLCSTSWPALPLPCCFRISVGPLLFSPSEHVHSLTLYLTVGVSHLSLEQWTSYLVLETYCSAGFRYTSAPTLLCQTW